MESASLSRRWTRGLVSNRLLLKLLMLGMFAVWAAPSLAQDAAVGESTKKAEVASEDADVETASWEGVTKAGIVLAVIIVPIIIGNLLAKKLRMPEQGWKFSLAIGSLAAAAVIIAMGEIKLGPDLSGGITLI